MKPATGIVLLLVVVVALYFIALGTGLAVNGDSDDERSSENVGGGWQSALGSMTSIFAPRLRLGAIACNGQPVAEVFKLTAGQPECALAFPRNRNEDYRKAELALIANAASDELEMFVLAKLDERWENCLPDPVPPLPLPQRVLDSSFRLQIAYAPEGGGDGDVDCWLVHDPSEPFQMTVFEEGGQLTLSCTGCSAEAQREVSLRMR
jgi:hypothetical protein